MKNSRIHTGTICKFCPLKCVLYKWLIILSEHQISVINIVKKWYQRFKKHVTHRLYNSQKISVSSSHDILDLFINDFWLMDRFGWIAFKTSHIVVKYRYFFNTFSWYFRRSTWRWWFNQIVMWMFAHLVSYICGVLIYQLTYAIYTNNIFRWLPPFGYFSTKHRSLKRMNLTIIAFNMSVLII